MPHTVAHVAGAKEKYRNMAKSRESGSKRSQVAWQIRTYIALTQH